MAPTEDEANPLKVTSRTKRSYVACGRCHAQKTKCSGKKPCRGCVRSGKASECSFPNRERKITVLESYIEKLQAENAALKKASRESSGCLMMSSPVSDEENTSEGTDADTFHEEDEGTAVLADALLENRLTTQNNCISSRPVYVGGAACTAFATRLGYHIRGNTQSDLPCIAPVLKHAGLQRSIQCEVNLPTRAYTQVLVQVVLRYIGQEYHLLRRRSYYEEVDRIYQNPHGAKQISLCKLFVVLALGEFYLKKSCSIENGERAIPGTQFFLQAVSLFQEHYEEPDISYIETLLLLSFYSYALNRKNTAYTYSGLALRLSLTMGLHRNITYDPKTSPSEIENRRRVWWTVYTFDRISSSKLGHAVMIKDEDIDAPLPSLEAPRGEEEDFVDAKQLIANIRLSQITGSIMNLIYGVPTQRSSDFVRNVHTILNNLKQWDADLPNELKLDHQKFPTYGTRPIASLRLHFNQAIILTTRPILLHVFNQHIKSRRQQAKTNGDSATETSPPPPKPHSAMTTALTEACIYAARGTASLLGQLWAEGSVTTFGFFDAHYAFSATVVLTMSDLLRPSDADRDAIVLSRALLQSMVDDGNLPARELHGRLAALQRDIDSMLSPEVDGGIGSDPSSVLLKGYASATDTASSAGILGHDASSQQIKVEIAGARPKPDDDLPSQARVAALTDVVPPSTAPLDVPFIQDFLGDLDNTSWSPDLLEMSNDEEVPWSLSWDAAEPI